MNTIKSILLKKNYIANTYCTLTRCLALFLSTLPISSQSVITKAFGSRLYHYPPLIRHMRKPGTKGLKNLPNISELVSGGTGTGTPILNAEFTTAARQTKTVCYTSKNMNQGGKKTSSCSQTACISWSQKTSPQGA